MKDAWWRRLPRRLLDEDARLRELVGKTIARYTWQRRPDDSIWLTADLLVKTTQTVEIRFPDRYPGECPAMRPVPYGTRLSSHQFGGDGVLCLELGPDNWHSRYMAADLLISAWKLLALEFINTVEPTPIPSRHVHTLGMEVRYQVWRLIVGTGARRALEANAAVVEFRYACVVEDTAVIFWITEAPSGAPVDGVPPMIGARETTPGLAVRVTDSAALPPTDVAAFRTYLEHSGVAAEAVAALSGLVLITTSATVHARYVPASAAAVQNVVLIPDDRAEAPERRPTAVAVEVSGARVAIVGLGSLGSKVAVSLARSGVTHFVLVDGDVFLPENAGRHDADYGLAGLLKVEAAAARIRRVASAPVSIEMFTHDVADGSNPAVHEKTVAAIANATLVLDATANADAFNFLADLTSETQRPFTWGEVFPGGLGGYIAYATPQDTPCPSCVRSAFLAHADEWPPAPRDAAEPYAVPRGTGQPIAATDADVTVLAGALTGLALRLLTHDLDGLAPVTLLGLRRGWIFEQAFDTRQIQVRTDDFACLRCWQVPAAPESTLQAQAEALLATSPIGDPEPPDAHHPSRP